MPDTLTYRRPPSGTHPPNDAPGYRSTALRHPKEPLIIIPQTLSEITGPAYPYGRIQTTDNDLTSQHTGEPLGERIIVEGRVLDEDGRPIPDTLVEVWQANAAGRYAHRIDQHAAPLDPNFAGAGRTITDDEGRYRFVTIRPGAYPWRNHDNAWRPAHIHFSLFGTSFLSRLVTQMYFPGDPLQGQDLIFNAVASADARERLVARALPTRQGPSDALVFEHTIVVRGKQATPAERE